MTRRVVITGMALASPLGSEVETAFNRLKKFENCVKYWEVLDKYDKLNTRLAAFVEGFKLRNILHEKLQEQWGRCRLWPPQQPKKPLSRPDFSTIK